MWCVGFMVQGSGFRVQGSGCRVQGSGFRVQGPGSRVHGFWMGGSGFVSIFGFRVSGLRGEVRPEAAEREPVLPSPVCS